MDSSSDTGERQRHQRLVGVCCKQIYQPRTVGAGECGLPRKAGSPQLVETHAASSAAVEMTWIKALWDSMIWRDFYILTQRRSSRPLKTMMPHVIRNENPAFYHPESTLVMDSKGLFDALDNDLPQDDRNPLWKCQSLKSLCAEQCVDLDGVCTIEMRLTP